MAYVVGTTGEDWLFDTLGNDVFYALQGDDVISVSRGFDFVYGAQGNDRLVVDYAASTRNQQMTGFSASWQGGYNGTLSDQSWSSDGWLVRFENIESFDITTGSGQDSISTGAGDDVIDGGAGDDWLDGGSGTDTLSYRSAGSWVSVSLAEQGNRQNSIGAGWDWINGFEHLEGSRFDDLLIGSRDANWLDGGAGDDRMAGGSGNDTLVGGDGNDRLYATNGVELGGARSDSDSIATSGDSGRVVLVVGHFYSDDDDDSGGDTGGDTGGDASEDDHAYGGGAPVWAHAHAEDDRDTLLGGAGDDMVWGGFGDTLDGGEGFDSFSYDAASRDWGVSIDWSAAFTDAGLTIDGATIRSFELYGALIGTRGDDAIWVGDAVEDTRIDDHGLWGGDGNDRLSGGAGDNRLIGGAGNDVLDGGAGNDTAGYLDATKAVRVNLGITTLQKTGGAGNDILISIENLIGSNYADTLTGNGDANRLSGGAGNDRLDGGGGADWLEGGSGNDNYTVDQSDDVVIETANNGTDTVAASASFTLSDHVENLVLLGSADIDGSGNGQANRLTGNSGANRLDGGAGDDKIDGLGGADVMTGGDGDDRFTVDDAGDQVIETSASGGSDAVSASVSFALGEYVESLMLTGWAAIDGTGNEQDNVLTGNAAGNAMSGHGGKDRLSGGDGSDWLSGGAGADSLTGGAGNDVFVFDFLGSAGDKDMIRDFGDGHDRIAITRAVFDAFALDAAGALDASAFVAGKAATTPDQHLIYNAAKGALYYDADGSGSQAMIQIASFSNHGSIGSLSADDFLLI